MRFPYFVLAFVLVADVVLAVPLGIEFDNEPNTKQEKANKKRLQRAKTEANRQIGKMRIGFDKYKAGDVEATKIYEAAFGKNNVNSDDTKVDEAITKLQNPQSKLEVEVAKHWDNNDPDLIAGVRFTEPNNGLATSPWTPQRAVFTDKFHGSSDKSRASVFIHEATHQLLRTGDDVWTDGNIVTNKPADNHKKAQKKAQNMNLDQGYTTGTSMHKTLDAVEQDKFFTSIRNSAKNMHDNADSYALYASLCSETYKRSLDLREYGLFRRALLERDDAQLIQLARRNKCKLPKDYFKKKASEKKMVGKLVFPKGKSPTSNAIPKTVMSLLIAGESMMRLPTHRYAQMSPVGTKSTKGLPKNHAIQSTFLAGKPSHATSKGKPPLAGPLTRLGTHGLSKSPSGIPQSRLGTHGRPTTNGPSSKRPTTGSPSKKSSINRSGKLPVANHPSSRPATRPSAKTPQSLKPVTRLAGAKPQVPGRPARRPSANHLLSKPVSHTPSKIPPSRLASGRSSSKKPSPNAVSRIMGAKPLRPASHSVGHVGGLRATASGSSVRKPKVPSRFAARPLGTHGSSKSSPGRSQTRLRTQSRPTTNGPSTKRPMTGSASKGSSTNRSGKRPGPNHPASRPATRPSAKTSHSLKPVTRLTGTKPHVPGRPARRPSANHPLLRPVTRPAAHASSKKPSARPVSRITAKKPHSRPPTRPAAKQVGHAGGSRGTASRPNTGRTKVSSRPSVRPSVQKVAPRPIARPASRPVSRPAAKRPLTKPASRLPAKRPAKPAVHSTLSKATAKRPPAKPVAHNVAKKPISRPLQSTSPSSSKLASQLKANAVQAKRPSPKSKPQGPLKKTPPKIGRPSGKGRH
ncbi:hypothetical protein NLI96_g4004 [Meripilus lineatus]|uniref:Lysine-specific metallo-endopeptidase domain-containing protein n=1 Tax=Meripilus lineatus TaxID=2056292 RepID=A0AAD5V5Z3_9APHY|nr:hypothetical protein NLI96_g4004 [Physisporinus lineatus]